MHFIVGLVSLVAFALAGQGSDGSADQIPLESSVAMSSEPMTLDNIPLLGFGTWNLNGHNVSEAVSFAIQSGYRHIDCAAAYGNEREVGIGIRDGLFKAGITREDIWVTSKLWNDHHGTNAPERALQNTLEDLGVNYLDLYLMHWPVAQGLFGRRKIEYRDTWAAMVLLLEKGMTKHIGVSNFDPEQLENLLNHTEHPPSVHQMELHPYLQQTDWVEWHTKRGIHVTAYSPFAGTNPTYNPGDPPPLLQNKVLKKIATKRGCSPAQVALVWGMSRGTSVIPKGQKKTHIEDNIGSLECINKLKDKDLEKITEKLGKEHHRFNNPAKSWGVDLYKGLEDSLGKHKKHE